MKRSRMSMVVSGLVAGLICGNFAARMSAQQVGRAPVEVVMPQPPTVAVALGRVHLVYELHVTNFGADATSIDRIEAIDGEGAPLEQWNALQIGQRLQVVGQPPAAPVTPRLLPAGARAVIYLWMSLAPGRTAPVTLAHRLTLTTTGVEPVTLTMTAAHVRPRASAIDSPVGGGPWLAVRGPSAASPHRLSLVALAGRVQIPQRFAVDWARLGDDGRLFRGDGHSVAEWYGYGERVHAVADGVVALTRDGVPDRSPLVMNAPPVIEANDATGNVVVLDIGGGRFATYAHLQPGSLGVKPGERVVSGQVLARIGNSGNTLAPHLHFQVTDTAEPLGGEGLPYSLRSFTLAGRVPALPPLIAGSPWTAAATQPARDISDELPLENMVVRFPARR